MPRELRFIFYRKTDVPKEPALARSYTFPGAPFVPTHHLDLYEFWYDALAKAGEFGFDKRPEKAFMTFVKARIDKAIDLDQEVCVASLKTEFRKKQSELNRVFFRYGVAGLRYTHMLCYFRRACRNGEGPFHSATGRLKADVGVWLDGLSVLPTGDVSIQVLSWKEVSTHILRGLSACAKPENEVLVNDLYADIKEARGMRVADSIKREVLADNFKTYLLELREHPGLKHYVLKSIEILTGELTQAFKQGELAEFESEEEGDDYTYTENDYHRVKLENPLHRQLRARVTLGEVPALVSAAHKNITELESRVDTVCVDDSLYTEFEAALAARIPEEVAEGAAHAAEPVRARV